MRSIDFPLFGGWHVTLFGPWALAAIVVIVGLVVVLLAKMLMAH